MPRPLGELAELGGDTAVFSHGHLTRTLVVRWTGLPIAAGRGFALGTAAISVLSWHR